MQSPSSGRAARAGVGLRCLKERARPKWPFRRFSVASAGVSV